jgi:hypothetical protein
MHANTPKQIAHGNPQYNLSDMIAADNSPKVRMMASVEEKLTAQVNDLPSK